MAYFVRRPDHNGKPRYVTVYVHKDGKNEPLPRTQTKHLDGQPDHNIQAWIAQNVDTDRISEERILWSDDVLRGYLNKFKTYLGIEGKAKATAQQHVSLLERYVIPYFLSIDPPLKDPNFWPQKSLQMRDWLVERKLPPSKIFRVNVALRKFFTWMKEEGYVMPNLDIHLRRALVQKGDTPLQYTLDPKAVLRFVATTNNRDLKLIAITGYFFSLRSQEILGLEKMDFRAGSKVVDLDCSKAMRKAGLFDKLAVKIDRQRNGYNKITKVKTKASAAWVSCFDKDAAKDLVSILNTTEDGLLLAEHHPTYYYDLWKKGGIKGVTIKDLRRASLYWLGHFSELTPIHLMKHARHAKMDTTLLYLRRPDEELEEAENYFDLDA